MQALTPWPGRPVRWRQASPWLALLLAAPFAITFVAYYVSPLVALALPFALGYLVLTVLAPAWAVAVACFLVVLESQHLSLGVLGSLSPGKVAFLLVGAGWVWRALSGDPGVRHVQIADYPTIAFVLTLVPGLAVGAPATVILRLTVLWTAFFLVFLTVKGFRPQELQLVLWALAAAAGVLALTAVLNYVQGAGPSAADLSRQGSSAIRDPNYFAAYLQMAAIPLLALAVGRHTRWRLPAYGLVAVACAGVAVSLSRGALFGLVVAVAVVVVAWSRTRTTSALVLLAVVLTTALNINPLLSNGVGQAITHRLGNITTQTEDNKRTLIWSHSLQLIVDSPLAGIGALQFPVASERLGLTERGAPLENLHNTYLNIAVEQGLLGLLAYAAWLARIGWDAAVEWRRRRRATFAIVVGAAAALVGFCVQGLTVSQYRVDVIFGTFFVLAGVVAAARAWPDEDPPSPAGPDQVSRSGRPDAPAGAPVLVTGPGPTPGSR